jgi:ABC-type sugar transport system substrate-binding protein
MNDTIFNLLIAYLRNKDDPKPLKTTTIVILIVSSIIVSSVALDLAINPQSTETTDYQILTTGKEHLDLVLSFKYHAVLYPDSVWDSFVQGAIAEAQNKGVSLRLWQGDWTSYDTRFNQALNTHSKGIIINTLDGLSVETIAKLTDANNIIVADNNQTAYKSVQISEYQAGLFVTKDLKKIEPRIKNAIILEGIPQAKNNINRIEGLKQGLLTAKIPLKAVVSAWWRREDAVVRTEEILRNYPTVNLIVCANDEMALGVIQELTKQNRTDVFVTGFDLTDDAIKAINQDKLLASIDTFPKKRGSLAVRIATTSEQKEIIINPLIKTAITKNNLDEYLAIKDQLQIF